MPKKDPMHAYRNDYESTYKDSKNPPIRTGQDVMDSVKDVPKSKSKPQKATRY